MQKIGEYSSNNSFFYNGNNGNLNNNNKYNSNRVRPVSDFQGNTQFLAFYLDVVKAYHICLKNKRHTNNALRFEINEESNLIDLANAIWNFEYIPYPSIAFIIRVPCFREVIAADFRDRIVQHYLIMKIGKIFDSTLDDDVYSCRDGRGTLYAAERLRDIVFEVSNGYTSPCWVGKFDIKSFFMSIDKRILFNEMYNKIDKEYTAWDKDIILYLLRITMFSNPTERAIKKSTPEDWLNLPKSKSLYNSPWWLGLAIGNLNSQLQANYHNAPFMKYLRSIGLQVVNYVDDFAFVAADKDIIINALPYIRQYLKDRGLTLHPNKFYLQYFDKGVKFVGSVIKANRMYVSNRTVGRLYSKILYYNKTCKNNVNRRHRLAEKFVAVINSYLGLFIHYNSYKIRKKAALEILKVWKGVIYFSKNFEKAIVVTQFKKLKQAIYKIKIQRLNDLKYNGYEHTNKNQRVRKQAVGIACNYV